MWHDFTARNDFRKTRFLLEIFRDRNPRFPAWIGYNRKPSEQKSAHHDLQTFSSIPRHFIPKKNGVLHPDFNGNVRANPQKFLRVLLVTNNDSFVWFSIVRNSSWGWYLAIGSPRNDRANERKPSEEISQKGEANRAIYQANLLNWYYSR